MTKLGQELPENAVIMEAKDFDEYLEKLQMILYNPDKYQIMEGSYDKSIIFSVDNQEAKYTCLDTFEDLVSFLLQLKHQEGCKIDIDTDYDFVYFLK